MVKELLKAPGIDVNKRKTDNEITPLWIASSQDNLDVVKALLAAKDI